MVQHAIRVLKRVLGHSGGTISFCHHLSECGDADERLCGLANPRHSQGHQHSDTQGEEPRRWAVHETGTGQEVQEHHGWPQPPAAPLAPKLTGLARRSLWSQCCEGNSNTVHSRDLLKQNGKPVEDRPVLEHHCCYRYMTAASLVYQKQSSNKKKISVFLLSVTELNTCYMQLLQVGLFGKRAVGFVSFYLLNDEYCM